MSLIEIKNSQETFASIEESETEVTLNTKDKFVEDNITIELTIPSPVGEVY